MAKKIDQVRESVFLGVIIYENLNLKSEILHVAFVNPVSIYLRKLYEHYIFLLSIHTFFYCNLVGTSTYSTNRICPEILKKRVIRTIAKISFDAHTDPIFQNFGFSKFLLHLVASSLIHVLLSKPSERKLNCIVFLQVAEWWRTARTAPITTSTFRGASS